MVNRELEHVLRLWEKSILLIPDSAAPLLSSPGVCGARLSSWLQRSLLIMYPLHFEESYKDSKTKGSSTAIFTRLPKWLIFCQHWGGRAGTDWGSSRHRERCPRGIKLKPGIHIAPWEAYSQSHQRAGLKEASVQLLWVCGVLCIPKAEISRAADLCYAALISSATFGKSRASLDGKNQEGECGVLFSSLSKPTL